MAHRNVFEALAADWKPNWNSNYMAAPLAAHIGRIGEIAQGVGAVRSQHVAAGKLTQAGILDKVREAAASEAIPDLRRAHHAVEGTKAAIAARKAALTAVKIDKADIVGAMVRQEIRSKLSAMDEAARMKLLQTSADPRVWDAYQELPIFAPIPADFAQQLEDARMEQADAAAVASLREAQDAVTLVETMLRAAVDEVCTEAEFPKKSPEFDAFMTEASAAVDAEIGDKEPEAKVDVEGMANVITGLAYKDRRELIDHALGLQRKAHGINW